MKRASMSLAELPPAEEGTVIQVCGGPGLVSRLATLGFTPGACLTMLQNRGRGPLIVRVRDTRIALGRGEALKIAVIKRANDDRTDSSPI
jgi:ferrous iron transport protein A